jgi:hypothetical protein
LFIHIVFSCFKECWQLYAVPPFLGLDYRLGNCSCIALTPASLQSCAGMTVVLVDNGVEGYRNMPAHDQ